MIVRVTGLGLFMPKKTDATSGLLLSNNHHPNLRNSPSWHQLGICHAWSLLDEVDSSPVLWFSINFLSLPDWSIHEFLPSVTYAYGPYIRIRSLFCCFCNSSWVELWLNIYIYKYTHIIYIYYIMCFPRNGASQQVLGNKKFHKA